MSLKFWSMEYEPIKNCLDRLKRFGYISDKEYKQFKYLDSVVTKASIAANLVGMFMLVGYGLFRLRYRVFKEFTKHSSKKDPKFKTLDTNKQAKDFSKAGTMNKQKFIFEHLINFQAVKEGNDFFRKRCFHAVRSSRKMYFPINLFFAFSVGHVVSFTYWKIKADTKLYQPFTEYAWE